MRYAPLLAALVLLLLPAPALAADQGACPVWRAERDVREARRALARSEARLAEAKKVLDRTRYYAAVYGPAVARWVRLARRKGFTWTELPTTMLVIDRESRGCPTATNASSGAAGLFQFLPAWWAGKWDPYSAPVAMAKAEAAVDQLGWSPWAVH